MMETTATSLDKPGFEPFDSLEESLDALVRCLSLIVPYRVWMVNRLSGQDLSLLYVHDQQNELKSGLVFNWDDSYCKPMVAGTAPHFAEDAQAIRQYREAGSNKGMEIGAYIGQPLIAEDGRVLGSLCAMDASAQPLATPEQKELVNSIARTISTLMSVWLRADESGQAERHLKYLANTDGLTKAANRQAWDEAVAEEEKLLRQLGENAMVAMIDLDGLKEINDSFGHAIGDNHLIAATEILRQQVRTNDVVARIGGDEFALLVRGVSKEYAAGLNLRITTALEARGVGASIGYAMRIGCGSLTEALHEADKRMYEHKLMRKVVA